MATEFKDKGNDAYKAGDFEKAVEFYTLGIDQQPSNAPLFSNRSAAYLKLQDYEKARRDAEMCIELNIVWSKVRSFSLSPWHFDFLECMRTRVCTFGFFFLGKRRAGV